MDLSHAADGYVGVAQDIRLIFTMLSGLESVDVSGLLMPTGRHDLPCITPGRPDDSALTASVLHWMERNWEKPERRAFPLNLLQSAQTWRQILRPRHQMTSLADNGQLNALWRILFSKTLDPKERTRVLSQNYYATDLSVSAIIALCAHAPVALRKSLNATGFDAVLFCMPRPVTLPRGVRQIVRFHDAVPVTDTDTVPGWKLAMAHSRLVRACAPDAIFVCNSPQSRQGLINLDPKRARHSVVIPCAVTPGQDSGRGIDIGAVIERNITFRALDFRAQATAPQTGQSPPRPAMRYLLSVSTLEPRKNFPGLIRGWERVLSRSDPDLRLIIVGGPGWREEKLLDEMRPGVASGRLLHLQNVPPEELQALMRGAECFAFPSFNEGFGCSPLEAIQAGTPCVLSDLPVFRWIFGDAAIYVDPYDTDAIATGIERLTCLPGHQDLRATLLARAPRVLARFNRGTVGQAWQELFEKVKAEGK